MDATFLNNPNGSPLLKWIADHLNYPHEDCCLIWPFASNNKGYGTISREKKKYYVHRIICELVNGPPPSPIHQATHSCNRGDEGCANPHHLRWKTRSENMFEAPEKARRLKITPDQAREIKGLKGIEHPAVTALRFGVHEATINDIHAGRTWKSGRGRGKLLSDSEVQRIRSLEGNTPAPALASEYGVKPQVIYNIWKRKTRKYVPECSASLPSG